MPAANSNDHLASVTLTTWSSGWQWGWGGWGWGGLWAGVNGWGGLWGAGWGMGWGMGLGGGWGGGWNPWWGGGWWNAWNSGYFGLSTPAELRLPANFWDVEGEVDEILEHGEGALMARFASGPFELAPLEVEFDLPSGAPAPGAPPPAPPAPATPSGPAAAPPAVVKINYDHSQIEEILAQEDPELAEWWSSRGRIARVVVPGRPADLPIATFANAEAIRAFEQRAFESRTAEQPWIKVPDEWQSWQVALHVVEQARTKGSELNKSFELYGDRRATAEETVNDVLPIPDAEPIEVQLASLDPENIPHEKVKELVRSGQAIEELKSIGRTMVLAVAARLPLADGTVRSLILEHVPPGWFTPDRWRIVGIGPIVDPDPERGHGGYSLEKALDTYVFAPKEAAMAQEVANAAEFTLHVIPLGGTVDYLSRGEYGEAAISFAGDVATLLTGGGSKVIAATRAAKGLGVTQKGLVTAGIITEASVAGIRGVQGALMLYEGKGGYGQIAEAVLRLFGVKLLLKQGNTATAAFDAAGQLAAKRRGGSFSLFGLPRINRPHGIPDKQLKEYVVKLTETPEFARDVAKYNALAKRFGMTQAAPIEEIKAALLNDTTVRKVKSSWLAAIFDKGEHAGETRFWLQTRTSSVFSWLPGPTAAARAGRHELVHLGAALNGQTNTGFHEILVQLVTTPEVVPGIPLVAIIGGTIYYITSD